MAYIFMPDIGYGDQLGSQMHNFAVMYAISKKTGHKLAIHESSLDIGKGQRRFIEAFDYPITILRSLSYKEICVKPMPQCYLDIDEDIININPNLNYAIRSRFDYSFCYWIHLLDEVINNLFVFRKEHIIKATAFYDTLKPNKKVVSMHFRRTDYLASSALNLSLNYYIEALTYFNKENYQILVFSDDIEWCKTTLPSVFSKWNMEFSENNSAYVDMYLMSMCHSNIIANSTFSSWGAWLNRRSDKKVISPEQIIPAELDLNKIYPGRIFLKTV